MTIPDEMLAAYVDGDGVQVFSGGADVASELLEERSINKSTLFTTQLPLDHWSEVISDPVIADAIRDRLEKAAKPK